MATTIALMALVIAVVALVAALRPRPTANSEVSEKADHRYGGKRKPRVRDDMAAWRLENNRGGESEAEE